MTVSLDPRSVWHTTWIVFGCIFIVTVLGFIAGSAGGAVFQIFLALFLAMAMEPAVKRLATRMPRGLATALVMLLVALAFTLFISAFGGLLMDEIQALVESGPQLITETVNWVNHRFGTHYDINTLLSRIDLTPEKAAGYASQVAGGVLGIVNSVVSTLFGGFVILFFTFYISAGMPRLRDWIAGLFPPQQQSVVLTVWELLVTKVGGYVSARFILATISATAHAIFMMLIGMPYFLALGLWTGLIAQFVPNIGTYISIMLPVAVGFTSDEPRHGFYVLIFAIIYQQIENVTIEPNISARAVNVHPAVSFASALVGVKMFGLAGGVMGVPVAATAMAIIELYKKRYEVLPHVAQEARDRIEAMGSKDSDAALPTNTTGASEPEEPEPGSRVGGVGPVTGESDGPGQD